MPEQGLLSCIGKLGTPPSLINPAQENQVIMQTNKICEIYRVDECPGLLEVYFDPMGFN